MEGPFDPACPGGSDNGYLNGGIGWYRKTFKLPRAGRSRQVFVEFDGVYMDSDVWINGHHLGNHPYGYTSFRYDLTPHLKTGTVQNVLAVRANVRQPCTRWYSGAGIYRHVRLTLTGPVRVEHWGTQVTTPSVSDQAAQVRVQTRIGNAGSAEASVTLQTVLVDSRGRKAAVTETTQKIGGSSVAEFDQAFTLRRFRWWSPEGPALYCARSTVRVNGRTVDTYETQFGIRSIRFTADDGFHLNGRRVQLKGVCNHHDLGCLGTAVHRRALERQLEILRDMGCNAIRTSHNPPAPELLELCDRMGFLVMDEIFDEWKYPKREYGYGRFFDEWSERDVVSTIHRDRNHPCVILWSTSNELQEQALPNGREMSQRLVDICHREDPTRLVTSGCNMPVEAVSTGFAEPLDVFGVNYAIPKYQTLHGRVLVATETASAVSTRGEYNLVLKDNRLEIQTRLANHCTSYDLDHPEWGCTAETSLKALKDSPWIAGEFVWTGFDYIGEPTPHPWPARSSYFGIIDLCGFPKDRYYVYQSRWTDKPMVHILPHWNWEGLDGMEIPVWCFSNCDSIELFLNGRSFGAKNPDDSSGLHLEWRVPFAPGTIKAVAKRKGRVVAVDEVRTAGPAAAVVLCADRVRLQADGMDLSFVQARIVDKDGIICPNASHKIVFDISGPGRIAGVDNGDPTNHEPFQACEHTAFHGLCLAVIKADRETGRIRLTAAADGLAPATAALSVRQAIHREERT